MLQPFHSIDQNVFSGLLIEQPDRIGFAVVSADQPCP